MSEDKPIAVFVWREDGDIDFHITDGVTLYCVDERSKSDRVYHYQTVTPIEQIMEIVGHGPVGRLGDRPERDAAIKRVLETGKFPGERGFLEVVHNEDTTND